MNSPRCRFITKHSVATHSRTVSSLNIGKKSLNGILSSSRPLLFSHSAVPVKRMGVHHKTRSRSDLLLLEQDHKVSTLCCGQEDRIWFTFFFFNSQRIEIWNKMKANNPLGSSALRLIIRSCFSVK